MQLKNFRRLVIFFLLNYCIISCTISRIENIGLLDIINSHNDDGYFTAKEYLEYKKDKNER